MENLLIVESPNKAKTIRQWLPKDKWNVFASNGHIKNLPKQQYSISLENNKVNAKWEILPEKKKLIEQLRELISNSSKVYIGTDDDREGERIALDLIEHFKIKDYYRVLFHEITKENIVDSLKNGLYIDNNRTNSQKARRVIDRIIGYPISSAIRDKFKKEKVATDEELNSFGIGRVTAAAINILVQNERRIQQFIPKKFKKIYISYIHEGLQFSVNNGMKFYEEHYEELGFLHAMTTNPEIDHVVEKYKQDTRDAAPYPPLITSRILRNLNYLYHYETKKTEAILQKLFEGVEIYNEKEQRMERVGLITYHRTDSFNISEKAIDEIRECLSERFGKEYVADSKRVFKNKNANAQEAHEAIRPTSFKKEFFPKNLRKTLSKEQFSDEEFLTYEFIFYRTLSTQMKNSIYDNSKLVINVGGNKFQCIGNKQLFDGWEKLLGDKIKKAEDEEEMDIVEIPTNLKVGDVLKTKTVTISEPRNDKTPPRIGVGRFITILDEKSIARPSTIGGIPEQLIKRNLVKVIQNMLIPTELAMNLIKLLEEHGEWLINIEHTEQFEKQLDEIEEGEDPNKLIFEYDKLKDELLDKLGFYYRKDNEPPQWLLDKVHGIAEKTGEVLSDSILKDATKIKKFISDFEKTTTAGKCPECKKSEVHERDKTFSCSNVACDFTIWKNGIGQFFNNFNKYMPECAYKDLIKHLIKNKMIWFEDLYSKKQEKNFAAYVVLEKNNKSFQLSLSFPRSKVKTIDEKYMFNTSTYEENEKNIRNTPVVEKIETNKNDMYSNSEINEIEDNKQIEIKNDESQLLKEKIEILEKEKRLLEDENDKDKLTRVLNRGKLEKDLKYLWESKYQDITFGFIDFDKFKNINDTYGHQAGDEVLIKSVDLIYKIVRDFDIKIYRYGGEEFCIVSEEEKSLSREIFESIRSNIKKINFNFNNTPVTVTISIGIAFRDKEESFESLIKRADEMVYKAKENGRDRIEISVFKDEEEIIW